MQRASFCLSVHVQQTLPSCATIRVILLLQTETFGTDMTPIARPAQPKEYGPPAVFLATETDSSYVVGAILSVTGGMLIN